MGERRRALVGCELGHWPAFACSGWETCERALPLSIAVPSGGGTVAQRSGDRARAAADVGGRAAAAEVGRGHGGLNGDAGSSCKCAALGRAEWESGTRVEV